MAYGRPPSYATVEVPLTTQTFEDLALAPPSRGARLPSAGECLAHLKLLECFSKLRDEIENRDGLFGIKNDYAPSNVQGASRNEIQAKIREKRWEVYVTKASFRFQAWWITVEAGSRMVTEQDMEQASYASVAAKSKPIYFDANNLPPVGE